MSRLDELDRQIEIEQRKWRAAGMRKAVLAFGRWAMTAYSAQNPVREQIISYLREEFGLPAKFCTTCEEWKELSDFSRYSKSPDGRLYRCKACDRAYKASWYQKDLANNREKHRGYWRKAAATQRAKRETA